MANIMQFLKDASPDTVENYSVPTLAMGQVLMGDVVYLPFAYLFLEKAVNAASYTLKVSWFSETQAQAQTDGFYSTTTTFDLVVVVAVLCLMMILLFLMYVTIYNLQLTIYNLQYAISYFLSVSLIIS